MVVWAITGDSEGPNPYPFCRCNPLLPSRRLIAGYYAGSMKNYSGSEAEYLKDTAEYLKGQLDAANRRLKDIDSED